MNIQIKCAYCGTKFNKDNSDFNQNLKKNYKTYCSKKCQILSKKRGLSVLCASCGKEVYRNKRDLQKSKSGLYFCSKSCSASKLNTLYRTGKNNPNFKDGADSGYYRKTAFSCQPCKCACCSYKNKLILEVHHKDNNHKNNSKENLVILCPTHHAEVTRGLRHL